MFIEQRLQLSLAPFPRPCCPECGAAMFLVEVEPDAPGSRVPHLRVPSMPIHRALGREMLSSAINAAGRKRSSRAPTAGRCCRRSAAPRW